MEVTYLTAEHREEKNAESISHASCYNDVLPLQGAVTISFLSDKKYVFWIKALQCINTKK